MFVELFTVKLNIHTWLMQYS